MNAVVTTILLIAITVAVGFILSLWLDNIAPPPLATVCSELCSARGLEYYDDNAALKTCTCETCKNVTTGNRIYGECQPSEPFIIERR